MSQTEQFEALRDEAAALLKEPDRDRRRRRGVEVLRATQPFQDSLRKDSPLYQRTINLRRAIGVQVFDLLPAGDWPNYVIEQI